MTEVIVFPDTVALVVTHLGDNLDEPVYSRIPNPRPAEFVTVQRTGGPRRNLVTDEAQITVDSWAQTPAEAHDLAQLARAYINSLPGQQVDGVAIYKSDELAGPADLPDPLSDQPRYSQSFAISARGTATGS